MFRSIALRFSVQSFFSVSLFALIQGFIPLYCKSLGFSALQISLFSGAIAVATIFSSPLILQLAHTTYSSRALMLSMYGFSALVFLSLTQVHSFYFLFSLWVLFLFLKRGGDALVDSYSIRAANEGRICYEHVRLWGSVGYIVASFLLGYLLQVIGVSTILIIGGICMVFMAISSIPIYKDLPAKPGSNSYPQNTGEKKATPAEMTEIPWLSVICLLVSAFLLTASHAPLYSFLSVYLNELSWSGTQIAIAWNLGVLSEIIFFYLSPSILRRFSLLAIYRMSLLISVIRWLLMGYTQSPLAILLLQCLHAFSFGAFYITSINLMFRLLPEEYRDRGQGYLKALGSSLGALIGSIVVGIAGESFSSWLDTQKLFQSAAGVATVALLLGLCIRAKQFR